MDEPSLDETVDPKTLGNGGDDGIGSIMSSEGSFLDDIESMWAYPARPVHPFKI